MGRNKLLLSIGGVPLVRRAVQTALGAGLGPVLVVTGHQRAEVEAALAGLACTPVYNPDYSRGMNTSLRAGLRAVPDGCAGAVVLLGDMPFIEREHVARLCEAFRAGPAMLVLSRFAEVTAPPILYGAGTFAALRALPDDAPAKAVIEQYRNEAASVEQPADALRDLDVPADVEAARPHFEPTVARTLP
jgi:molybdenum cofactor cytidylyltransferase